MSLEAEFGQIDIYWFDQILRGRVGPRDTVMDAGCGFGRNLLYPMRQGWPVCGIDQDADAVAEVRRLARDLAPTLPADSFRAEPIERSTFPDACATVVVSSAVLHFAPDDTAFDAMLAGSWRLLAPGGMFFCRLASSIGFEARVRPLAAGSRRHRLPDGTDRYLVDEALLMTLTRELGGQLLDPIKTSIVQDQRAMTTWVLRKD